MISSSYSRKDEIMSDIIVARELTKKFGDLTAVDRISFTIKEGELFGFLGPNGAGKTTTINMLTTLIKPTSGEAYVYGYSVKDEPYKVREVIGLVPQDITVDDDLTGKENLYLQAALYHIPREEVNKRIKEALELVDLTNDADRKVETYSGGMRKRLEIACGLIHRPKILFLDEPTLGLDVQTRAAIWEYINMLRREHNMTIFMTTHYMDEADSLCDRIAIIDHGEIKAIDTPSNLKNGLGGDIIEIEFADKGVDVTFDIDLGVLIKDVKEENGVFRIKVSDGEHALPRILEYLVHKDLEVSRVLLLKPSLDEVFLELTGRALRDEEGSWEEMMKRRIIIRRRRR